MRQFVVDHRAGRLINFSFLAGGEQRRADKSTPTFITNG